MIEALASWTIGALLGTVLRRATRARRRREGARARQRRAVRALLGELSAFATGLELDIRYSATIRISNPEAVEVTWREHRVVLAGLPACDVNVIERAVANVVLGRSRIRAPKSSRQSTSCARNLSRRCSGPEPPGPEARPSRPTQQSAQRSSMCRTTVARTRD